MTAFARQTDSFQGGSWSTEIRSVNNRFLDLSIKIPASLSAFETEVRELIQARIRRGKVSLFISEESRLSDKGGFSVNEALVKSYLEGARKLSRKYKLTQDLSLADVLRLPGVLEVNSAKSQDAKIWAHVKKLVKKTVDLYIEAKEKEGRKLGADISKRLGLIREAVKKIKTQSEGRSEEIAQKLSERLKAILQENEIEKDDRFFREVAYLAERNDITEELVRLESHLSLFEGKLKTEGEAGREFDFLCQEINREVNTIGSKAQVFEIAADVIFIKGELEKIREQIQNIE